MPPKAKTNFPGRETLGYHDLWTAKDDDGNIRVFKWDYRWSQYPRPNQNGMTGDVLEWIEGDDDSDDPPERACRLHICAFADCPARYDGHKRGHRGPCTHVRFIGWKPTEEAATLSAVSPGGASSGDATVVPSSAMGGGPATDMHSAVVEVPGEELHVAVSPAECGGREVGGLMWLPRCRKRFLKE